MDTMVSLINTLQHLHQHIHIKRLRSHHMGTRIQT
jgi:hypothetical protein